MSASLSLDRHAVVIGEREEEPAEQLSLKNDVQRLAAAAKYVLARPVGQTSNAREF